MSGSPRSVLRFLGKMLAAYVAWYTLYDLWLLPDGRLDAWVSHGVAAVSGGLLSGLGLDAAVSGRIVTLPGTAGVKIINGCNGIATLGLFVGFILAYPGRWARRAWFIPMGMAVIYLANVVRIALMALVQQYWPAAFDPLHGVGLTSFFYAVVFGLWVLWVRVGGAPSASDVAVSRAGPSDPAFA